MAYLDEITFDYFQNGPSYAQVVRVPIDGDITIEEDRREYWVTCELKEVGSGWSDYKIYVTYSNKCEDRDVQVIFKSASNPSTDYYILPITQTAFASRTPYFNISPSSLNFTADDWINGVRKTIHISTNYTKFWKSNTGYLSYPDDNILVDIYGCHFVLTDGEEFDIELIPSKANTTGEVITSSIIFQHPYGTDITTGTLTQDPLFTFSSSPEIEDTIDIDSSERTLTYNNCYFTYNGVQYPVDYGTKSSWIGSTLDRESGTVTLSIPGNRTTSSGYYISRTGTFTLSNTTLKEISSDFSVKSTINQDKRKVIASNPDSVSLDYTGDNYTIIKVLTNYDSDFTIHNPNSWLTVTKINNGNESTLKPYTKWTRYKIQASSYIYSLTDRSGIVSFTSTTETSQTIEVPVTQTRNPNYEPRYLNIAVKDKNTGESVSASIKITDTAGTVYFGPTNASTARITTQFTSEPSTFKYIIDKEGYYLNTGTIESLTTDTVQNILIEKEPTHLSVEGGNDTLLFSNYAGTSSPETYVGLQIIKILTNNRDDTALDITSLPDWCTAYEGTDARGYINYVVRVSQNLSEELRDCSFTVYSVSNPSERIEIKVVQDKVRDSSTFYVNLYAIEDYIKASETETTYTPTNVKYEVKVYNPDEGNPNTTNPYYTGTFEFTSRNAVRFNNNFSTTFTSQPSSGCIGRGAITTTWSAAPVVSVKVYNQSNELIVSTSFFADENPNTFRAICANSSNKIRGISFHSTESYYIHSLLSLDWSSSVGITNGKPVNDTVTFWEIASTNAPSSSPINAFSARRYQTEENDDEKTLNYLQGFNVIYGNSYLWKNLDSVFSTLGAYELDFPDVCNLYLTSPTSRYLSYKAGKYTGTVLIKKPNSQSNYTDYILTKASSGTHYTVSKEANGEWSMSVLDNATLNERSCNINVSNTAYSDEYGNTFSLSSTLYFYQDYTLKYFTVDPGYLYFDYDAIDHGTDISQVVRLFTYKKSDTVLPTTNADWCTIEQVGEGDTYYDLRITITSKNEEYDARQTVFKTYSRSNPELYVYLMVIQYGLKREKYLSVDVYDDSSTTSLLTNTRVTVRKNDEFGDIVLGPEINTDGHIRISTNLATDPDSYYVSISKSGYVDYAQSLDVSTDDSDITQVHLYKQTLPDPSPSTNYTLYTDEEGVIYGPELLASGGIYTFRFYSNYSGTPIVYYDRESDYDKFSIGEVHQESQDGSNIKYYFNVDVEPNPNSPRTFYLYIKVPRKTIKVKFIQAGGTLDDSVYMFFSPGDSEGYVGVEGGTITSRFNISGANITEFDTVCSGDWFSVSPVDNDYHSYRKNFTVTVNSNTSGAQRTGTITFTPRGYSSPSVVYTVTQKGYYVLTSPISRPIDSEGKTFAYTFFTNYEGTLQITSPNNWVTIGNQYSSPEYGSGAVSVNITVAANDGPERSGSFTLSIPNVLSKEIVFTQEGAGYNFYGFDIRVVDENSLSQLDTARIVVKDENGNVVIDTISHQATKSNIIVYSDTAPTYHYTITADSYDTVEKDFVLSKTPVFETLVYLTKTAVTHYVRLQCSVYPVTYSITDWDGNVRTGSSNDGYISEEYLVSYPKYVFYSITPTDDSYYPVENKRYQITESSSYTPVDFTLKSRYGVRFSFFDGSKASGGNDNILSNVHIKLYEGDTLLVDTTENSGSYYYSYNGDTAKTIRYVITCENYKDKEGVVTAAQNVSGTILYFEPKYKTQYLRLDIFTNETGVTNWLFNVDYYIKSTTTDKVYSGTATSGSIYETFLSENPETFTYTLSKEGYKTLSGTISTTTYGSSTKVFLEPEDNLKYYVNLAFQMSGSEGGGGGSSSSDVKTYTYNSSWASSYNPETRYYLDAAVGETFIITTTIPNTKLKYAVGANVCYTAEVLSSTSLKITTREATNTQNPFSISYTDESGDDMYVYIRIVEGSGSSSGSSSSSSTSTSTNSSVAGLTYEITRISDGVVVKSGTLTADGKVSYVYEGDKNAAAYYGYTVKSGSSIVASGRVLSTRSSDYKIITIGGGGTGTGTGGGETEGGSSYYISLKVVDSSGKSVSGFSYSIRQGSVTGKLVASGTSKVDSLVQEVSESGTYYYLITKSGYGSAQGTTNSAPLSSVSTKTVYLGSIETLKMTFSGSQVSIPASGGNASIQYTIDSGAIESSTVVSKSTGLTVNIHSVPAVKGGDIIITSTAQTTTSGNVLVSFVGIDGTTVDKQIAVIFESGEYISIESDIFRVKGKTVTQVPISWYGLTSHPATQIPGDSLWGGLIEIDDEARTAILDFWFDSDNDSNVERERIIILSGTGSESGERITKTVTIVQLPSSQTEDTGGTDTGGTDSGEENTGGDTGGTTGGETGGETGGGTDSGSTSGKPSNIPAIPQENLEVKFAYAQFPYYGSTDYVQFEITAGTATDAKIYSNPTWVTNASVDLTSQRVYFTISENNTTSTRSGVVAVNLYDAYRDGWYVYELTVTQYGTGSGSTLTIPAWRDTYYEFSSSPIEYTVRSEGETLFTGNAVATPGSTKPKVNVSSIFRDYVGCEDLTFGATGTIVYNGEDKKFEISTLTGNEVSYIVHNDWSYDSTINYVLSSGNGLILSDPINGHFDTRMYFLFTSYQNSNCHWDCGVFNGSTKIQTVPYSPSYSSPKYTATLEVSGLATNATKIIFSDEWDREEVKYDVQVCGSRYALYYRNRKGGFDSFLIEGKVTRSDSYSKESVNLSFNNTRSYEFGKRSYHKDITTKYTLSTGWLKDDESERLAFNLVASPQVYLHDLLEGTIKSVNITNSSVDYKNYRNERKLFNYQIEVEESQAKLFI